MPRRLLKRLQETVLRRLIHAVCIIYQDDAPSARIRKTRRLRADRPNLVDADLCGRLSRPLRPRLAEVWIRPCVQRTA